MIRTEVASLLLVLFALFSQPAQATPVTYQIDYSLIVGGPKPLSTLFTFDPGTNLFANLRIVWIPASPASPTAVFFDLLGNNVLGYNINNFSPEARLQYFARLLDGGTFDFRTSTFGFDAYMNLDGDERFFPNGGNNLGNTALGTFATAQVPEPTSLILSLVGIAGLLLFAVSAPFRQGLFMRFETTNADVVLRHAVRAPGRRLPYPANRAGARFLNLDEGKFRHY